MVSSSDSSSLTSETIADGGVRGAGRWATARLITMSSRELEVPSKHGNLAATDHQDRGGAYSRRQRQREQKSAVAFDLDPEDGEVRQDGASHRRQGEARPDGRGGRQQQARRCQELDQAGSDPAPRLRVNRRKDVDGLLGAGELEEERLRQDDGDGQLGQPADEVLGAGERVHAPWMTRKPS